MKTLILLVCCCLLIVSCGEFNDSKSKNDLFTPVNQQEFEFGDTIYFTGDYKYPVMEFNSAQLLVLNLSNNSDTIFDQYVGTDFTEKLVHQFKKTTYLRVIYKVTIEDCPEEVIKDITIKCNS